MVGVITGWDILAHPISTIRCFGWRVFFRAVAPWQDKPFLSLLQDAGFLKAGTSEVPTILERCIALELRVKRTRRIRTNCDILNNLANAGSEVAAVVA